MTKRLKNAIATLEALALATPGVIGIAEGLSTQGEPCIKLLLSVPVEEVVLPEALKQSNIELEYIGKPKAQEDN